MRKILLFLLVACLASCQADFDEIGDTTHRHIDFRVDLSDMFADVLFSDGIRFHLGQPYTLPSSAQLRVSVYCYDVAGRLVFSDQRLVSTQDELTMTVRHLQKNDTYHFVFLADVVETDEQLTYRETWYQLGAESRETLYLLIAEQSKTVIGNVLKCAEIDLKPDNQQADVDWSPLVTHGYVVLTNTERIALVRGLFSCSSSFLVDRAETRKDDIIAQTAIYPNGVPVVWPIFLTKADGQLSFSLDVSTADKGQQTFSEQILMDGRKPFVVTVDCSTLQIADVKYY